jgi:hypothetical protein
MTVHWNEYLEAYVMIFGTWEGDTFITRSDNLLQWQDPQVLLAKSSGLPHEVRRYFTLVGTTERHGTSDQACGSKGWLMYQYKPTQRQPRDRFWYIRSIEFLKSDRWHVIEEEPDAPVTPQLREARDANRIPG